MTDPGERNDGDPAPRRRRPYGRLLLVALLAALVAVEVAVRIADARAGRDADFYAPASGTSNLYRPHPFIGYVLRPGAERDRGRFVFSINSLGFRGPERSAEKPDGVYRILCLGGSTTYGTGVSSNRATYPAQLERLLNQVAPEGRAFEVWNCGVSGYTTAESLVNLELRLLQYEPDAVVVYHAANDARPIQARGFEPDYTHVRRSWVRVEITAVERFLLRHWRTFAWATRGTDPARQLGSLSRYVGYPDVKARHQPSDEGVPEEGVATFLRNVRSILAICRENGVQPFLSTFATCRPCWDDDKEHFWATVARLNDELKALAAETATPLVDVAAEMDDRTELYTDWMHFNDQGSLIHARLVARAAREAGLLAP